MTDFNRNARPEMGFNPLRKLTDLLNPVTIGELDRLLLDNAKDTPELYAFLAQPTFQPSDPERMKLLKQRENDPFDAGMNYSPVPKLTADGAGEMSLILALEKEEALRFLAQKKRHPLTSEEVAALEFTNGTTAQIFLTIGYARLEWHFRSDADMVQETGSDEEFDPDLYHLYLHPDAVFISNPFRGFGLGASAGVAMAKPFNDEIYWLDTLSSMLGINTKLQIQIYFELHSEGGEAVVSVFNSEIEEYQAILDEDVRPESGGLKIVEIYQDGGY